MNQSLFIDFSVRLRASRVIFLCFGLMFFVLGSVSAQTGQGTGSYNLPFIVNPPEPPCNLAPSSSGLFFKSIKFDGSAAPDGMVDLEIFIVDASVIPQADRYEIYYIDDNYFSEEYEETGGGDFYNPDAEKWKPTGFSVDEIESGQTLYFQDWAYSVEKHRYYRFVVIDQNNDVVYANDRFQSANTESNIAAVLEPQKWTVEVDRFDNYGSPRHSNEIRPSDSFGDPYGASLDESLYLGEGVPYVKNGFSVSIWHPKYSTDAAMLRTMYTTINWDWLWVGYDVSPDVEVSNYDFIFESYAVVDANKVQRFSIESRDGVDSPRDSLDPSNITFWQERSWIDPYPYSVQFYDFRGKLSAQEDGYLNPMVAGSSLMMKMRIEALSSVALPSYHWHDDGVHDDLEYLTDAYSGGKIKITWNNSHLNIEGYDPIEERVRKINSPYVIEPEDASDVDLLNATWTITPQSWPSKNETDIVVQVYLPGELFPEDPLSDSKPLIIEEKYTVRFPDRQTAKAEVSSDYFNIPFDTATGPRYRKIGLNGRPLSDEKPQATSESDEAKEETYVDAFNLNLVHSVTDIYVPIQGSELALSLRRNLVPEVWSANHGLRPYERPDKPFGAGWSSNVVASVKVITPDGGPGVEGYEDPVKAYVTDENGNVHEFVQYENAWFPMPSASHEARAYLTTLTDFVDHFVFQKKHGNTLKFNKISGTQDVMRERVEGSQNFDIYSYARLDSVTDRLGYKLKFIYTGAQSLIPNRIYAENPAGTVIPGQQIDLAQSNGRVTHAWDPNGNVIDYKYASLIDPDGWAQHVLETIDFEDGSNTEYGYKSIQEGAYVPLNSADMAAPNQPKVPPYEDPTEILPCDGLQQYVNYNHLNLTSITDANKNAYHFTYKFDHSKEIYVNNQVANGYFLQTGSPRFVATVTLPDSSEVTFKNGNLRPDQRLRISTTEVGYQNPTVTNSRSNSVVDAEGFETAYLFTGSKVEILTQFKELLVSQGIFTPDTKYKDPRILYYTGMTISHGEFGTESFKFDPNAGLALKSATDLSGNVKSYSYGEDIEIPPHFSSLWPSQYGEYNDPTKEVHSGEGGDLSTTKTFSYEPKFRIMTEYVDPEGRRTETLVDGYGRRTEEMIYSKQNVLMQRSIFDYDPIWRGVATGQTVKQLGGIPDWAVDITTTHQLDANGRVIASYSYPLEDAAGAAVNPLVSAYTYDLNNNRLSVTKGSSDSLGMLPVVGNVVTVPGGKSTSFEYDKRNRLRKTVFHDGSDSHNVYDPRGNVIAQIDENDHATIHHYDSLNRRVKTIRVMDDAYPNAPPAHTVFESYVPTGNDLVSSTDYNNVNSVTQTSSADGATSTMYYDGLQRLIRTEVTGPLLPGSPYVTRFIYGKNSGGSVFNVSGFQPTLVVDPRGFRTEAVYDSLYRSTETRVEYEPGLFATTSTEYDKVGNPKSETDPLGKTTTTLYDALNRPTKVTFANNTTEITSYTSTGLAYSVTDQAENTTSTRYDGAGRPIEVQQPEVFDFDSGSDQIPITRTYYDAYGNTWKSVNPRNETWETLYDARNRPTTSIAPPTEYIDELGAVQNGSAETETGYDLVGNVISRTDARGFTQYTAYDAANRPVLSALPQVDVLNQGNVYPATKTTYDRAGNLLAVEQGTVDDPTGTTPVFTTDRTSATNTYDALGRLLTSTDAEQITVENTYDAVGNRITVTDGKNQTTTFTYDGLNRNRTTTYGGTDTTELIYNGINQTRRIDANDKITDYTYDDLHRLTSVIYSGAGSESRSYTYDAVGNIETVTEPGKSGLTDVAYEYDALYRVKAETSSGIRHEYQYDLAGNRRETRYDAGGANERSLEATYDPLNRTEEIIESDTRTSGYDYDLGGNIRQKLQANGDTVGKTYDALGRTQTIVGPGAVGNELYTTTNVYDLYGNLAQITEAYPNGQLFGRTITNGYDGANRLTTETIVKDAETTVTHYGYDAAHNRTSKQVVVAGVTTTDEIYDYSGNSKNQIQAFTDSVAGRTVAYTYDANGNRTTRTEGDNVTRYTYDRENRLIQLTESETAGQGEPHYIDIYPGNGTSRAEQKVQATYYTSAPEKVYHYAYDYRTRRVLRDESGAGGSRTYLTFSGGTSVQEYQEDGNSAGFDVGDTLQVEYIRGSDYGGGIGGILYTLRSGAPSFKHYNSRGDVVAATDVSGSLTYQAAYEAFGKHGDTASSQESGSTLDRQQANTKEEDPTGLLNEGFRYRDLETGTFITRDPLGFVDGPNVYTYVVQNPWTYFDPLGLEKDKDDNEDDKQTAPPPTPKDDSVDEAAATSGSAATNYYKQQWQMACVPTNGANAINHELGGNVTPEVVMNSLDHHDLQTANEALASRGKEPMDELGRDWEKGGSSTEQLSKVLSDYQIDNELMGPVKGEAIDVNQLASTMTKTQKPALIPVKTKDGFHSIMATSVSMTKNGAEFTIVDPAVGENFTAIPFTESAKDLQSKLIIDRSAVIIK